jgi:hypothetical protein
MLGLEFLTHRKVGPKDAVMFDIDDTLIDTIYQEPIYSSIRLAQEAKNLGYKVIIITARPNYPDVREFTISQLNEVNVPFDELYLSVKKSDIKQDTGYKYILSVGDQWHDTTDSEHFIKLPGVADSIFHMA